MGELVNKAAIAALLESAKARLGTEVPEPTEPRPEPRPLPIDPEVSNLAVEPSLDWRTRHLATPLGPFNETHVKSSKAAKSAEWFIKRATLNNREEGHQVVIFGPPGCGKTHLAGSVRSWFRKYSVEAWYCRHVWNEPPRCWFIDWGYTGSCRDYLFEDTLTSAGSSAIVVIDDIGTEVDQTKSGEGVERLRRVLNACERKWLFVTTNIGRDDWPKAFDGRVASRLDAAHYVDMSGAPDHRPRKFKLKTK